MSKSITKGDSLGDNLCIRLRSYLSEIIWDKNNKDRREAGITFNKFMKPSILLLYIGLPNKLIACFKIVNIMD